MSLFEFVLLLDQDRSRGSRSAGFECLRPNTGATFTTVKSHAHQFYQTTVINVPCRRNDEIAVRELARMEADGGFVIESRHCFPRAFDRAAKRLIREIG